MIRAFAAALIISVPAYGLAADIPGLQFLLLEKSMRGAAMGDAYTALSDDQGGVFGNPAGIAYADRMYILGGGNEFQTGSNGINNWEAGILYPDSFYRNAWAVSGTGLGTKALAYDSNGNYSGNSVDQNIAGSGTFAQRLGQNWSVGLTGTYASETLTGDQFDPITLAPLGKHGGEMKGYCGTLGGIWASESDRWRVGAVAYNFGKTDNNVPMPSGMRMGIANRLLVDKSLTLSLDLDRPTYSPAQTWGLGGEWKYGRRVAIRSGLKVTQGSFTPSVGIGFSLGRLILDLASSFDANLGESFGMTLTWWINLGKEENISRVETNGKALNVAVSDLKPLNVSQAEAGTVTEFLRIALVNTGSFRVVERANMDKILAEQKFQRTGCTSEECAVQMGKILNVQKIVSGTISSLKGTYYINVNIIDVEKGEIEAAQGAEAGSTRELKEAVDRLADKLREMYH